MRLKGFILSAGFGTRLKPITDKIPKALVRLGDKPLIRYGIDFLRKNSVNSIGVNIHYKKELMGEFALKNNLIPFYEEKIQGTGGYLKNLSGFFDTELLTVNCDTLFFRDETFIKRLIETHCRSNNLITLGLKRAKGFKATRFEVEGDRVLSIGIGGDFFFTGLQLLSPKIIPFVEYSIVEVYKKLIPEGRVGFVEFKGDWFDCGTLEGLISANKFLFKSKDSVVYRGAYVSPMVKLKNSVIYDARVDGSGILENSIVYNGALLNLQDEKIKNKIIV